MGPGFESPEVHHYQNGFPKGNGFGDHTLSRHEKPDGRIRRILLAKARSAWLGSESPEVHHQSNVAKEATIDFIISGSTSRTMKSVTLTQRVHLFPFRTQKLSFAVLTILAWRRAGKIGRDGHCQSVWIGFFLFLLANSIKMCYTVSVL